MCLGVCTQAVAPMDIDAEPDVPAPGELKEKGPNKRVKSKFAMHALSSSEMTFPTSPSELVHAHGL